MKDLCAEIGCERVRVGGAPESRETLNILFGPPSDPCDAKNMVSQFLSKEGIRVVCGGTTASLAAKHLGEPIWVDLAYTRDDIPPVGYLKGVDLVTDGVLTLSKVVLYAKDYLGDKKLCEQWRFSEDGASLLTRLLLEKAGNVNLFVGKAVNPAHQGPDFPIPFDAKMDLAKELMVCLSKMGKRIKVCYF